MTKEDDESGNEGWKTHLRDTRRRFLFWRVVFVVVGLAWLGAAEDKPAMFWGLITIGCIAWSHDILDRQIRRKELLDKLRFRLIFRKLNIEDNALFLEIIRVFENSDAEEWIELEKMIGSRDSQHYLRHQ